MTTSAELPPFSDNIWFDDGSLRDAYFFNTTLEDHEVMLDYLKEQGARFGTYYETEGTPSAVEVFADPETLWWMSVLVGGVAPVNISSFFLPEIEFDIDPRTVLTAETHQSVLLFFVDLAHRLSKPFFITYEMSPEEVLLHYDPVTRLWTRYRPEGD